MKILISFDIDGTLEVGDPPGPITMDMVRKAQELGCIIGTCSDRPLSAQRELLSKQNIQTDFTALKHMLGEVKGAFGAEQYYHIGDTELDRQFAQRAGFGFIKMDAAATELWIAFRDATKNQPG